MNQVSPLDGNADVAVIMTCYNEGDYIGEAVRSVLDQSIAQVITEIVIADDGSEAETIEILKIVEGWDPRIRIIYGKGGRGLPAQRNLAISYTTASFVAILDGDDIWASTKLEMQMAAIDAEPGTGLVYSDFFVFPERDVSSARRAGVRDISQAADLKLTYFLNDPPIIPSTILIRRTDYLACGKFDDTVRVFEDTDFFLRMAGGCRFALVNEPLIYKRNRGASITGGRKDLMAHHAFVAFKAAATDPRLMSLVPRRLAERARKLGNQRFLVGDIDGAVALLSLSLKLYPLNYRTWLAYVGARFFPTLSFRALGRSGRARRAALGGSRT
ncbi:glycosyltransferase family 2 protein [Rhizobium sp.]|uniref:glycosyltransferase family 2 protein n=1 Tax=Rhizobium sp. TaxID=391 RepID=UPI0028A78641